MMMISTIYLGATEQSVGQRLTSSLSWTLVIQAGSGGMSLHRTRTRQETFLL